MDFEFETRAVHGGDDPQKRKTKKPSVILDSIDDEEITIENESKLRLEKCIASLEKAKYCLCYPSGTAAITSISMLIGDGDHAVFFDSVYHGTRTNSDLRAACGAIDITFADLRDASVLEKHMKPNTKMVWIETPCNPTMKIVDISAIAQIVKRHGKSFLVVDNTFMSPYFQNPLLLGADIAMHSLTKYMNGHSDVLMGAAATNREDLYTKLKNASQAIGSIPSPLDCYLCLRGMKTLHLRMERHKENGFQVARFLESHPNVEKVLHPGLESHPQHDLAKKQCTGFSGMVSFCIKGGIEAAREFAKRIKVFTLAVSLGTIESLVDIPPIMTASPLSKETRAELEIPENLIRLSIGIEDARDLIADLDQALRGE
ncbi:cystathionine gamma-lyase-like isoform X1 [Argiope bruennichi]|uniref:cystathionine gamma-lyase-like isoform X1 n=1 Tax=Argiope bruennichi TaxID=94029 RepID=UPI00249588CC|nr:cystathionine gamma-lyase-like isoform X1 [Argiope bruennichi]